MSRRIGRAGQDILLRGALALVGLIIVFLGLNVGLGGIETLGWQGGGDFLTVTDADLFGVRDNHVRFIGGVWLGVGVLMLAGAVALERLAGVVMAIAAMVFIGGLARFSALDPAVLTSAEVLPSLLFELVAFPLIGLWVMKRGNATEANAARD